ncbi:MAG: TolC family protein [Clostridia bacterium]|nr:TolC family protein [Clostridia bacterium]
MKKICKLLVTSLLCFSCFLNCAYAQEAVMPNTYTLTLDEAVNMALEDNPQIKVLEIEQESNRINLLSAQLTKKNYKNYPVSVSNYDLIYIKNGYYVDMYKMLIDLNPKKIEQAQAQIKYNVTESYYNYKIAETLCDIAADAYELAKENLDNVAKRYELGMIAQIDFENAKLSVDSVKNTYDTYVRNAGLAKDNLKIHLQLDDENCEFILTDDIDYEEFSANADEDIKKAMDSRCDVSALKMNYKMAQKYFDYTEGLGETTAKYHTAYSDFVAKEHSYTNNSKLIALSVKSCYNNVLNCADSLATAEKSADIARQRYDINKVKFESGMITNSELTQSLNEYLSENVKLENAKLNYKMAVEKYRAEISVGL